MRTEDPSACREAARTPAVDRQYGRDWLSWNARLADICARQGRMRARGHVREAPGLQTPAEDCSRPPATRNLKALGTRPRRRHRPAIERVASERSCTTQLQLRIAPGRLVARRPELLCDGGDEATVGHLDELSSVGFSGELVYSEIYHGSRIIATLKSN